nr:DUF4352 domain-containing protein [uncultured Blautia sp.]
MKKKVLLQVMGAVLVAGLMAGCGGTNDTKKEENTKTEAAADKADAKEETDSTEAEDTSEDSASTDSAEADSTGEESVSSDSTEADSAEVADSKETEAGSSAGTAAQTANSDAYGEVVSVAGWNITVEDVEINSSLENVSVELGYTGVETSDYKKEADAGKTFCMIKLKIEKDGSKETLDWANLKLTDSEGNEYSRMDDEFITELGMTRMAGTTLNFGSNEGWIAFEIDENAEGLELSYPFEAEEYHCAL